MDTRRTILTICIIVTMLLLYLLIQPLGDGYQYLGAGSYSTKSQGVASDNKWSRFKDEGKGVFSVHPGERDPVSVDVTFKDAIDAAIKLSIREGGKAGNILFTITKNGQEIDRVIALYGQPASVTVSVGTGEKLSIAADKNGVTSQDWGDIRIQEKSQFFTLKALLTPLLWALLTLFLASKRHLSVAINAYIIFLIFLVADKISFGVLGFRNINAYSVFSISLTFVFVWIYQELYWARRFKLATLLSIIVALAMYTIPLAYIIYFLNFNQTVDKAALFAIFQTNAVETVEYVTDFISLKWLLLYVFVTSVIGILMLTHEERKQVRLERSLLMFLIGSFSVFTLLNVQAMRLPRFTYDAAQEYRKELTAFRKLKKQYAAGQNPILAQKDRNNETHVIIIGESLNKRHMGLYGYVRDTTPRLNALMGSGQLAVYQNAFSNHTHTMPVLSHALTEANQFNGKSYFKSASIINTLNAAGFETTWITNQNLMGAWDNTVSVIADSADNLVGINSSIGKTTHTQKLDGELLPYVRLAIDSTSGTNKAIFVHLMGNHGNYCSRFPDDYMIFKGALAQGQFGESIATNTALTTSVNCYDNSVAYNDFVVSTIIAELEKKDGISTALYIADHADDVFARLGHNSAKFTFEMTNIPLIFWTSDTYNKRYPDKSRRLHERVEKLFPNDLLYDSILGLLDVRTTAYQAQHDLTSPDFKIKANETSTLHGKRPLTDDANYLWWHHTNRLALEDMQQDLRVIPHRINSTGKLADVWQTGYRSFEVDILFEQGEPDFFLVGHEKKTSGKLFNDFLASVNVDEIKKIWLDLKNLSTNNYLDVLQALEELDQRYALKNRIILESGTTHTWFSLFRQHGWHTSYHAPTGKIVKLLKNGDTIGMEDLAKIMADQTVTQNVAAVSFDHRAYPFIKTYLEPKLSENVVYHSRYGPTISNGKFVDALNRTPIFQDRRIKTILVPFKSPFSL